MSHNNLSPEIIFAAAIWLTAILIFVLMVIATFVSLISENRTKTKIQFSRVVARFTKILFEQKDPKIKYNRDIS